MGAEAGGSQLPNRDSPDMGWLKGAKNTVDPFELPSRVAGVLPLAHLGSRFSPVEQEVAS
jgi:hypothetical protein